MAKRNRNENKKNPGMERRDRPLPSTLPSDLKPYDTNNDGVLSKEERIAMKRAKSKEDLKPKRSKAQEAIISRRGKL